MRTGTARNGDVELHWMDEGDTTSAAVVLINGAGSTAVMWCRELIDPLLDLGYRVVRFDNRDVGRSTRIPTDESYYLADLAQDLGAVMDGLGIDSAHLVGRSMGGMTAMEFAVRDTDRVDTLTLIYTSPAMTETQAHGLPAPRQHILDAMAETAFTPPPKDAAERVRRRVEETKLFAGNRYEFDEGWAQAEAVADATHAPFAEPGHAIAVMASPSLVPSLSAITCAALVLHGTEDPIIDVEHGRFLDSRLPDSRLIEYDGLGHEMPPAFCAEIMDPLRRHLSGSALLDC